LYAAVSSRIVTSVTPSGSAGTFANFSSKPNCSATRMTRFVPICCVMRTVGTFSDASNASRSVTLPR
jgi:hypothetical protein